MKSLNLSAWSVKHPSVVLFLIIAVTIAGAMSYVRLGRAEDPSFTIKTMIVQAFWPGATAQDMQRLVAEPLEKRLQELPQLDFVRTYSRPGASVMLVQLKDYVRGRAAADTWYQVRKKFTDSRSVLPDGVIGPVFDDEFGDVFSAVYMLTSDGATRAELKQHAEKLRTALLRVPETGKINLVGDVPERVYVEVSNRKLATLGIPTQTIFDAIGRQNLVLAAGSIETASDRVIVRVNGAFQDLDAIRAVPISANGQTFQLRDIATIVRSEEDPAPFLMSHRGKPAVGVAVAMADGGNVLALGERLKAAVGQFRETVPLGLDIEQVSDQPKVVEASVSEFLVSFAEALAIVLVVSFISLGLRTGIVVALSVPLVLAIVFVMMAAANMNFDRITLGALIIALGLLVDDAIIAIEMMVVKMEQGYDRFKAATFAWESTAFPMLTGTLVTAAGFLPVGFAASTAGEYAGNIFWVVGMALVVSWFVAVVFTPYLGVMLLPDFAKATSAGAGGQQHGPAGGPAHGHGELYQSRTYRALRAGVTFALGRRYSIIALTVGAFALAIVGMGFVQQQFFPTSSRPELLIETRMPEGSAIGATAAAARKAERLLEGDDDVVTYTTYVGQGSPRFFLALNPVLPNPSFALTVIMAKDATARDRVKARLQTAIDAGAVPEARMRIDQLLFGPPVGFPVQFRIVGPDPVKVREIAYRVRDVMRTETNAIDPQLDWNEQVKSVVLDVDQDRVRALGLNTADIAGALQTLLSGTTVSEYREGTEILKVVVRATPDERRDLAHISDLAITSREGRVVPVAQVATIRYTFEEPILWRRNRDMVLTVRADVVPGVQAPSVTNAILPKLAEIKSGLAPDYRIDTGGAIEESAKANEALFKLFPLMILAMLTLLMFQLQSFAKLLLVFSTAPLGLIGAVAALLVFNAPFGFVALLGVIALAGMIMRNTVILVDQIDHDLADGLPPWDAIVESTVRRARPVVLTALAAILAMIPLTKSVFWGPMALSIMGGLAVATALTLFFLPALYAAWFQVERPTAQRGPVTGHAAATRDGMPDGPLAASGDNARRVAAE